MFGVRDEAISTVCLYSFRTEIEPLHGFALFLSNSAKLSGFGIRKEKSKSLNFRGRKAQNHGGARVVMKEILKII